MYRIDKNNVSSNEIHSMWSYLQKQEELLKRNRMLGNLLVPLGSTLFLLNLLLATLNIAKFFLGDLYDSVFSSIGIYASAIESFPRGSLGGVIVFSVFFVYGIPLAICGGIWAFFYFKDRNDHRRGQELRGNDAQCARALVNRCERVYEQRKGMRKWSIFPWTAILTGLVTLPVLLSCMQVASADGEALFGIALYSLILLVVLFVLFWVFALLFQVFFWLNGLFFRNPSEWDYYELYQHLDAYWESVDGEEHYRRQRKHMEKEARKTQRRRTRQEREAQREQALPEEETEQTTQAESAEE